MKSYFPQKYAIVFVFSKYSKGKRFQIQMDSTLIYFSSSSIIINMKKTRTSKYSLEKQGKVNLMCSLKNTNDWLAENFFGQWVFNCIR